LKTRTKTLNQRKNFNVTAALLTGVAVIGIGFAVVSTRAASGTAALSLTPASAIQNNGSIFQVSIYEDSGTAPVNAVQANLSYPATGLQLNSIDATNSAFPLSAQQTGANGTIQIARAINGGTAPVTGKQLVATLTFQSLLSTGSATVTFTSGSAVVSSIDNTGLILTTQPGTYAPDTTAPTAPTSVHVTATTGTSISIGWTAATDNVAVTGYNVYRDTVKTATLNASAVSYTDTGLAMGTTHSYQVTAFDAAANESVKSNSVSATTPDTVAPSVPTGLTATAAAYNKVTLGWNASTDTGGSGLAGYRIYRNGASTALTSVAPGTGGTVSFTDTTAQGSTTYTYVVSAYDGAGNESAKSTSAAATTPAPPDTTPPTVPGSFTMTGNSLTSISLSWSASTDNVGLRGYQLYRDNTLIASPQGTTYVDSNLAFGTTYAYSVKAVDTSSNVSTAATLSAATLPLKVGDINFDNAVDVFDLSILLTDWNTGGPTADLNHDATVNIYDLSILISNWGK
jgi:chitodextrinase